MKPLLRAALGLGLLLNSSDFERRHEAILEGEKAAADAMPQIK